MCKWVVNTPLGLFFYTVYVLFEFYHDHSEAVVRRFSVEKMFIEISKSSQENACARDPLLINLQANSLAQFFSWKFCEISKNTFSTEHVRWLLGAETFVFYLFKMRSRTIYNTNINIQGLINIQCGKHGWVFLLVRDN